MGKDDPASRRDLETGLRYVHQMEIEGRLEQTQLAADVAAIKALLIERGALSAGDVEHRRRAALDEQSQLRASRRFPSFGPPDDKYAIESPEIPCEDLLPICRAACCNLELSLSIQDLEEGVIRWKYDRPYLLAQDPVTGKCVHFAGSCTAYAHRPGPCREFDCRTDERIWKDYERRIPSDILSTLAPVPVLP